MKSRPRPSSSLSEIVEGGGGMGERIRAYDWASHPLGPPDKWPQSLKTVIRLMLNSRYAMWMGWGPEFWFFCNDAYLPTVGLKRDWVLGASAKKVWAEIWQDIGPLADSVVTTGQATWNEFLPLFLERSGYPEETYHTFSYSPIPTDDGSIGGMLCVVTEETTRVIGERRLAALRELTADLTATKTEPEVLSAVERRLGAQTKDLPFSLVYLFDEGGDRAHLAVANGLAPGHPLAPLGIDDFAHAVWPAQAILDRSPGVTVEVLDSRGAALPTGFWSRPPDGALVVPLVQPGHDRPAGFLVAGLNPHQRLGTDYRGFLDLVAGQIAAGLSNVRAYEAERRRAEGLAELDRAKTEFFNNVSHELRTPLTLLLGPIEEIANQPEDAIHPGNRALATVAHRNGLRLLKLVNTLLDFSRIEAGRLQASYRPVDLAAVTTDLASLFRSATENAGLKLVVDCPPLPEPVYVDRDLWEKIVLNLLSNAFKFTFAGEIRVTLRAEDDFVALSVSDTGTGIAPEAQARVFERFYRVPESRGRTHEGTGIGLALVQELAQLHGGSASVQSEVGRGSTFTVRIRRGTAHLPETQLQREMKAGSTAISAAAFLGEMTQWLPESHRELDLPAPAPAAEPLPRVLLADDNADMRDYVARLLGHRFTVATVDDGEAALAAIRRERPELVLSDVMMPAMDGFELLRQIRADPALRTLPVILLSARAGEEARVGGIDAGADDYLAKPFSAPELIARVSTHIELARARRENEQALADAKRQLEIQVEDLRQLHEMSVRLSEKHELAPMLAEVLRSTLAVHRADLGLLSLVDAEGHGLRIGASQGFGRAFLDRVAYIPSGGGAWGTAMAERRRVVVEDVATSPLFDAYRATAQVGGFRAVHSTPLITRSGTLIGALSVHFRDPHRPSERETQLMDIYAQQAADLIEAIQLRERAEHEFGERLRTQAALHLSEDRLRLATITGKVGIWDWDITGNRVVWSESLYRLHGLKPGAFGGTVEDFNQLVHPEDRARVAAETARILESDTNGEVEFRAVRPDGSVVWLFVTFTVTRVDGQAVRASGATLDISDRKAAELSRQESAAGSRRLAVIVENSDDAIVSKDLNGVVTSWNHGAERIFGYPAAEAIGQPITLIIPREKLGEEPAILARVRRGERLEHFETIRQRKDGTLVAVSVTVSPLRDATGRVVGASKIARDITDRKQAEASLAGQKRALELLVQGAPLSEVLAEIVRVVDAHPAGMLASVMLVAPDGRHLLHGAAPSLPEAYNHLVDGLIIGPNEGSFGAAVTEEKTFIAADIATDPRWEGLRATALGHGLQSCWAVPIFSPQHKVLGVFVVYHRQPHEPTPREREIVDLLVHTAEIVIERYAELTRRRDAERDVRFLAQLSQQLTPVTRPAEIIRLASQAVGEHLGADRTYICEWKGEPPVVTVTDDWVAPGAGPSIAGTHDLGRFGPDGWWQLLRSGNVGIEDVETQALAQNYLEDYRALQVRAYATASFSLPRDQTITIAATSRAPRTWTNRELRLLENAIARVWPLVERSRSQEAVRENEERLRQGLAAASMGSWRVDLAAGLRTRDANLNRILGYPGIESTLPLEDGPQLIHSDDHAAVVAAWNKAVAERGVYEAEFRVRRTDGAERWVREQGRVLVTDHGAATIVTGVTVDITERKRTDAELHRRTTTLEILNRVGTTMVAERDLEKIVQAVTDAGREISGAGFGAFFYNVKNERGESYTLYTLSGVPREAFSKFPMPRNTAVFAPTFSGEGVVRVGDILTDPRYGKNAPHRGMPAGHLPVRSYLAVPVRSSSGEVLGGLFFGHPQPNQFTQDAENVLVALAAQAAIAIDNANLYSALQRELVQQRRTEAALRESEAQLRLVTDHAPVQLAHIDVEHRYKFVNRPYAAGYRLEPADFAGRHMRDVIGEKAYLAALSHIENALTGHPVEFEMEIDYEGHLGRRWSRITYAPERSASGEVIGILAVLLDINVRKLAERDLEQARDQALAASRAKDEFLAALSHELRTPLNPVLLLASDAATNPALSAEVRADFEAIRKNVDLEARLIDDLLDLTRITRGKLPLDLRSVKLHAIIQDALATVRTELEAKHLLLALDFDADDPTVWGDEVRLQQVFWNVLKNAVKFTPEYGRISVATELDATRGMVQVRISDTGIGMTTEELSHVFESFSQGEHATRGGSHRFGGLGLGLAISRMLVDLHSGRIAAASEGRDRGAEFTIELPLRHGTPRTPNSAPAWPLTSEPTIVAPRPAAPSRRVRLLLVEDHAPTRHTLTQLLVRRHYEVQAAASVAEARALAAANDFELVISDIGLPDGDGYGLMTELRAQRPGLSGIALSGYGMEEDVARSHAAGFAAHLIKPVNIGALEEAINRLLASKGDFPQTANGLAPAKN